MNQGAATQGVFLDLESVDHGDLDRTRLYSVLERWTFHDYTSPGDLAGRIRHAQVIVTNKVNLGDDAFRGAKELQLIALVATGANNIDLAAAGARGITVCNIRDYASGSVAQHAITLMLNLLTGMPWYRDRVRNGDWSRARQFSISNRTIREARGLVFGVVGYGVLGRATADLARSLGMSLVVAERRGCSPREGRLPFEDVVSKADVLSLHCPLNPDTHHLVNGEVMQAMKSDALLINTSRGGVVDPDALAEALRAGTIGGAGIDTLEQEPPPDGHVLLAEGIPNLIVTPHNAWASQRARQAALDQVAEVIACFSAGKPINCLMPVSDPAG